MRRVTVIARKEYTEHVRNYWIIATAAIFFALMLVASGIVSVFTSLGRDLTLASIRNTIGTMRFVAAVILPILALMIGYGAIAGERESGSLSLLAAQPVTRAQVLFGKYFGLWGVLSSALLLGIGIGGLIVLANTREGLVGAQVLVLFLIETLAWSAAWLSITMLISAAFAHRSTALAGSVLVWFLFAILWVPLTVLIVTTNGATGVRPNSGPQWLILLELLNPNSVYGGLVSRTIGGYPGVIGAIVQAVAPLSATPFTYAMAMLGWMALPLAGAYALFRARDA